jgi:hypothetical protein
MKAVSVLDKTKAKPKARKLAKKAVAPVPKNGFSKKPLSALPANIETETEKQRKKQEAALKTKTLKAFQMFYDTYHAK